MRAIPPNQPGTLAPATRKMLEGHEPGRLDCSLDARVRITPRPRVATAPLSLAQEQIWRRELSVTDGSLPHNECITIKPPQSLDAAVLQRCFSEIIRRHEIWRTNYDTAHGQAIQVVHDPPPSFPLPTLDLRAYSEGEREAELRNFYTRGIRQPFDLRHGPLLRVTLVTLTDRDRYIVIFAHLSIVDGVSVYHILPSELASLYEAFSSGRASPLGELSIQYADYAHWQRRWLMSRDLTEQLTYWRKELTCASALHWPSGRPRLTNQTHRGAVRSFALRQTLKGMLKRFSRHEGVTLFTMLAASLGTLLYCYTGQIDIILGTPSLGARKRPEFQGLMGHFLNPVPLRINLDGAPPFREVLLRTRKAVVGAICHDDVPLQILAQELGVTTGSPDGAFFNVAISLQPQTAEVAGGWHVTSMDADSGGTIWDLYLAFIEAEDGLTGRAQYRTDLFEDAHITRVLEGLQAVMETVAGDPMQPISILPLELRRWGLL